MPLMRASPGNWNPHLGNTTVWSINTQKNCVEYSQNGGRSWVMRCCNGSYGEFRDLLVYGRELLACTNEGRSFAPRCTNNSYGDFLNLQDSGIELLANTSKGLYYSRNEGRSWVRRWCCHTYDRNFLEGTVNRAMYLCVWKKTLRPISQRFSVIAVRQDFRRMAIFFS